LCHFYEENNPLFFSHFANVIDKTTKNPIAQILLFGDIAIWICE